MDKIVQTEKEKRTTFQESRGHRGRGAREENAMAGEGGKDPGEHCIAFHWREL